MKRAKYSRFKALAMLVLISWAGGNDASAQNATSLRIISYNVENLFDTQHDSLKNDTAFLPEAQRRWTYTRYQRKIKRIAQVIANMSEWETPLAVGLCEVENERCLQDLQKAMPNYPYQMLHHEGPDLRGIDCALLYDKTRFRLLRSAFLTVRLGEHNRSTREIVYACGRVGKDTLHLFVCHLPSQWGTHKSAEQKQNTAKQALRNALDSVLNESKNAKIVVMGDFNNAPQDDLAPLHNLMLPLQAQNQGSYRYQEQWDCLDQFYISPSLLNQVQAHIYAPSWLLQTDEKGQTRPFRTYIGPRYNDGYSDHLPVYLDIQLNAH